MSQDFAEKSGRPKFELVMSPRVRGLEACINALQDAKPDIVDITIAYDSYSGEVPTWEMGMFVYYDYRVRVVAVPFVKYRCISSICVVML